MLSLNNVVTAHSSHYHNYSDRFKHKLTHYISEIPPAHSSDVDARGGSRRAYVRGSSRWRKDSQPLCDSRGVRDNRIAHMYKGRGGEVIAFAGVNPARERTGVTTNGSRKWPRIDSQPRSVVDLEKAGSSSRRCRGTARHPTRNTARLRGDHLWASYRRRRRDAHVLSIDRSRYMSLPPWESAFPASSWSMMARSLIPSVISQLAKSVIYLMRSAWCKILFRFFMSCVSDRVDLIPDTPIIEPSFNHVETFCAIFCALSKFCV